MIELLQPLFFVMFAVAIVEGLMLGAWKPLAFRSGFAIYQRSIGRVNAAEIDTDEIEAQFSGRKAPSIAFRKYGESEIFSGKNFSHGAF